MNIKELSNEELTNLIIQIKVELHARKSFEDVTITTNEIKKSLMLKYIDEYCESKNILKADFLKTRNRDIKNLRFSLIAWMCFNTQCSLSIIGKMFGNKHHSTIIHARDAILEVLSNPRYNQQLDDVFGSVSDYFDEITE